MNTPGSIVTIEGNGAILDAGGTSSIFLLDDKVTLVMSNVTMMNAGGAPVGGGAIVVGAWGTSGSILTLIHCTISENTAPSGAGAIWMKSSGIVTLTSCTFDKNTVANNGGAGAIAVDGGIITLTSCTFSSNNSPRYAAGAMFFSSRYAAGAEALLKGCLFVGPITPGHNDIANNVCGQTPCANVTFACADGLIGSPVQMQGNEITVIPPKELQCTKMYYCPNGGTQGCVPCDFTGCKGIKNQTECNSVFPGGCPKRPHWD
jgi:parallel beta-helix repeat protein